MTLLEKTVSQIHNIATGRKSKRRLLAPLVGGIFSLVTFLFAAIPVYIDKIFSLQGFIPRPFNIFVSILPALAGLTLSVWSAVIFFNSSGTPVPVNPPPELITKGPYAYTRNPMHTGLFLLMIASGIYFDSWLSVLVFTPVYICVDTLLLKYVEEPELEKRLGEDYLKYKNTTPMFFPWK